MPNLENIEFPFILKPIVGANSEGCTLVQDESDFLEFQEIHQSDEYVKQSFITEKKEYACHILIRNGMVKKHLCIEYIFGTDLPIKTINSPISKNIVRENFLCIWEDILREISYDGFCCVNYKIEKGIPKILEINPRVGGSLCEYLFSFIQYI